MSDDEKFMREAVNISRESMENHGGPFGAVIVRDGEIVAVGCNTVPLSCDPTAHAEVSAIRAAANKLGTFDLSGCVIYTSCEPCPMCLGAIYWAHLDKIFYANDRHDAQKIGFDDEFIYRELALDNSRRKLPCERLPNEEAAKVFEECEKKEDKITY